MSSSDTNSPSSTVNSSLLEAAHLQEQEQLDGGVDHTIDEESGTNDNHRHHNATTTTTTTTSYQQSSPRGPPPPPTLQQQQQQQQQGYVATCGTPEVFHEEERQRASYSWRIADFDSIPTRSRDGSIHATDEVFNAASHLSATMLSILGTVLLISQSSVQGNPWKIVSFSLYGASLIFLFACSTLHHSIVGSPKVEGFLRMMDYLAIYPLISGTFTPLCLVFYHDSVIGWTFIGSVWGISIVGMIGTAVFFVQIPKWLSMTMYITLGWMGGCMTYWLLAVLGSKGFGLFFLGGVCYTVGGYIYTTEQPNPYPGRFGFHELWHIAVIAGAFSHWCLMYFFVLPWEPGREPGEWDR